MERNSIAASPSNATEVLIPRNYHCPPGQYDCFNNQISDNQIRTALWVSAAVGIVMLLLFGATRKHMRTYKLRLMMPNVWVKPPPLPEGGIQQLW